MIINTKIRIAVSQVEETDGCLGIVIASEKINPEVEKYARSLNKPILEYQGEENYVDAYNEFYDKIKAL